MIEVLLIYVFYQYPSKSKRSFDIYRSNARFNMSEASIEKNGCVIKSDIWQVNTKINTVQHPPDYTDMIMVAMAPIL